MKIRYLDGHRLYYAFLAGGQAVIRDQAYLNKINVFPIPDSDTGTNLASTMRSIAAGAKAHPSATEALGSIADAALVGARGNSGLIFAQFLYGLSQEVRGERRLSVRRFAESVRRAVQHARRAVLTPVEGTMITLLHDWAEALYEQRLKMTDFAELLTYSLPIAERSLADTPKKLAVLARAGVVDAGARGFFDFLQGVVGFIRKGSIKNIRAAEAADLPRAGELPASRSTVTKRFCSEALLVGEAIDVDAVQVLVRGFGDSAVVAGSPRKLRLHVHTDDAAGLFFELQKHGTIQDIKADDMLRQYEAAHERQAPIAVLTDSACDLPKAVLDDHQVHVVPFNLFFGDSLFLDKVTIEPDRFYDLLRTKVDEAQERTGRTAFLGVDGPALRAGAGIEAIVLGDRGDRGGGVGPQLVSQFADELPAHLFVREAELGVFRRSLAVDLAEPIRMRGEISGRGDKAVERVDEALVDLAAAAEGVAAGPRPVRLVPGRPHLVESDVPVRLAVFERRLEADVEVAHLEGRTPGHAAGRRCPPAAADDVLEERVDGVEGAPRAAPGQDEVLTGGPDDDRFGREVGEVDAGRTGCRGPDQEPPAGIARLFSDGEGPTRDDVQEERQLAGGEALRRRSARGHDHADKGVSPAGDPYRGGKGSRDGDDENDGQGRLGPEEGRGDLHGRILA